MFFRITILVMVLLSAVSLFAQEHKREKVEWFTSSAYNADESKIPRALLIGDSICNGYQQFVRDELAGNVDVAFLATSKCVTDKSYIQLLGFMLDEYSYSVICFNNGLHSLSTDPVKWEAGLRATIHFLKAHGKGAKIYWISSTPNKDLGRTEKIRKLNEIAARIMREENIQTEDLFSLMLPLERNLFWSDDYHFRENAKRMQAKAIAKRIMEGLGMPMHCTNDSATSKQGASLELKNK